MKKTEISSVPAAVRICLEGHRLTILEFEPGSTPTAEAAGRRLGVPVGQIAKSMLFKGKDGHFRMVVLAGNRRINSGLLKRATGVKHRMATAEESLAVTGYRPGGVCPFALEDSGVEILLDESLCQYETIYPAAGTDASGVPMSAEQLQTVTGGRFVAVTAAPDEDAL
ncbi:MAG: aminoacyl-tRNA deacylase [Deltaproteobacteria bacterium]|nr:MAG: aminoacyl-tRNA deacylase [Deltaproteobacteria bacterium]